MKFSTLQKIQKIVYEIEEFYPENALYKREFQSTKNDFQKIFKTILVEFYIIAGSIIILAFIYYWMTDSEALRYMFWGFIMLIFMIFIRKLIFWFFWNNENEDYIIIKTQIDFLSEKLKEYFNEMQISTEIHPETSLAFADIIEIFGKKISEKQKILAKYKKSWIRISRPFFILQSNIPEHIKNFFKTEEQKIIEEIIFAKNCIQIFAEIETQKIQKISKINTSISWNLALSNKRQESLLMHLENLKKVKI